MNLLLNIEVNTNTGVSATEIAGTVFVKSAIVGINVAKIYFHKLNDVENILPENVGKSIYPVVLNVNNSIDFLVTSCEISLTQQDLDSNTLEQIIYQKTSTSLNQEYGWTTSVI
jgi:hypothetical protein